MIQNHSFNGKGGDDAEAKAKELRDERSMSERAKGDEREVESKHEGVWLPLNSLLLIFSQSMLRLRKIFKEGGDRPMIKGRVD